MPAPRGGFSQNLLDIYKNVRTVHFFGMAKVACLCKEDLAVEREF